MARMSRVTGLFISSILLCLAGCGGTQSAPAGANRVLAVSWPIDNTQNIGGYQLESLGNPAPAPGLGLCFDGGKDGLIFPVNPLDAQDAFTIQVLLKPDRAGAGKQQFLHLQDAADNRVLMEIRLADESWYLHSFVQSGDQKQELSDDELQHSADQWHWVALTYADGEVRHYVAAREQGRANPTLPPMRRGEMSLGTRLTRENWFKGCIRELRFATAALAATELAR
jgi:hypothetical protein